MFLVDAKANYFCIGDHLRGVRIADYRDSEMVLRVILPTMRPGVPLAGVRAALHPLPLKVLKKKYSEIFSLKRKNIKNKKYLMIFFRL